MTLEVYNVDNALISYAIEDSFGEKPSSISRFMSAENIDVGTSSASERIVLADQTRTPYTVVYGPEEAGGTIPGSFMHAYILSLILGVPDTTSLTEEDYDYEHVWENPFKPKSFSVQVDLTQCPDTLPDGNRHIVGCVASSLSLTIPEGNEGGINFEVDYDAKEDQDASDTEVHSVDTFTGDEPFQTYETRYKVNGEYRDDLLEVTLNFDTDETNIYRGTSGADSYLPSMIAPSGLDPNVEAEVLFKDNFWRDKIKNREKINDFVVEIDKSDNRDVFIEIEFVDLTVDDAPMDIPDSGEVQDTVNLTAENVVVTVRNDESY